MLNIYHHDFRLRFSVGPSDSPHPAPAEAAALLKENNSGYVRLFFDNAVSISKYVAEIQALFTPIGAAGGLVQGADDSLLWIQRLGKWDLPKGKIEANEAPPEAGIREVAEETGVVATIVAPLMSSYHVYLQRGTWYFKTTYWFRMAAVEGQSLVPQTEEGVTAVRWVPLSDLPFCLNNTFPSVLEVVQCAGFSKN